MNKLNLKEKVNCDANSALTNIELVAQSIYNLILSQHYSGTVVNETENERKKEKTYSLLKIKG